MTKYSREKHSKQTIQSQFSGPVYGNKACKLCKNGYVQKSDRSTYVDEYTTCGDIHLQLSHKKESDDGQCASGMSIYIPLCCDEETSSSGLQIDLGLSTLVITGLLVFFGCRRRIRRIAAEKQADNGSLPVTHESGSDDVKMNYKRMKDTEIEMRNSERNLSKRSRSSSRTRSRSRSKAGNRSNSLSNSERETAYRSERRKKNLEGSRRGRSSSIPRGRSRSIPRAPSPSLKRGADFKRVPTLLV